MIWVILEYQIMPPTTNINIENTAGNMTLENIMTLTGTNVGINTTTPDSAFKLDVSGTARFTTGVQTSGDIIVKNGGKIGINLNGDPGADFAIDVSGVGKFTRGIVASGNIIAESSEGHLQIEGRAAIGGVLTNNRLEVYGSANISQALTVSTLYVNESGAGATIYLGGGSWDDNKYDNSVIQTREHAPNNSELLIYKGNDAPHDRIRLRAGTIMFDTMPANHENVNESNRTTENIHMTINNAGNVGIGTVTPNFRLDVNGSARVTGGITGRISNYDIHKIENNIETFTLEPYKGYFIIFKGKANCTFTLPAAAVAKSGAYYKVANLTTAYNITFKNSSNDNILILYPSQVAELIASDESSPGTWEILAP